MDKISKAHMKLLLDGNLPILESEVRKMYNLKHYKSNERFKQLQRIIKNLNREVVEREYEIKYMLEVLTVLRKMSDDLIEQEPRGRIEVKTYIPDPSNLLIIDDTDSIDSANSSLKDDSA